MTFYIDWKGIGNLYLGLFLFFFSIQFLNLLLRRYVPIVFDSLLILGSIIFIIIIITGFVTTPVAKNIPVSAAVASLGGESAAVASQAADITGLESGLIL